MCFFCKLTRRQVFHKIGATAALIGADEIALDGSQRAEAGEAIRTAQQIPGSHPLPAARTNISASTPTVNVNDFGAIADGRSRRLY